MTFTAIFTYKGTPFIRQVEAEDPTAAARIWGKSAPLPADKTPIGLVEATEADAPAPLKEMNGVYIQVLTFGTKEDYGVLVLVQTKSRRIATPATIEEFTG